MRVTQSSMTRNYINNLNSTLVKYNQSMDKVSSGRRFTKMSEAVADGSRALRIRAQLYKNAQMQRNINGIQEELNVAETNMMSVKDVLDTAHEQAIKVQNGINEPDNEYQIYSSIFDSYKDQIFQWSNSVYGDKYLFSGTQNAKPPYEIDEDGDLTYNGIKVNDIFKNSDGDFVYNVETSPGVFEETPVPYSNDIYVDIGLNVTVNASLLEKKSAFNISVSGLNAFGYGQTNTTYQSVDGTIYTYTNEPSPNNITITDSDINIAGVGQTIDITLDGHTETFTLNGTDTDNLMSNLQADISSAFGDDITLEDNGTEWVFTTKNGSVMNIKGNGLSSAFGVDPTIRQLEIDNSTYDDALPNNIYDIFSQMSKALDEKDLNRFAALDIQLQKQSKELMIEVADIGVRGNYLSTTLTRYQDEELTLTEMQTNVEKINDAEEITTMRSHEYAWNLTLQFGSSFLPMSLMDYIK